MAVSDLFALLTAETKEQLEYGQMKISLMTFT